MINRQRLIDSFMAMVQIDSLSFQEKEFKDYLQAEFNRRQVLVWEDRAGEVIGGNSGNLSVKIKGDPQYPPLLISAHMDTVEPGRGIKAVVENDEIIKSTGPTILGADDKAAIAAILEAVDVISEQDIDHPPIELLFTVAEEKGLKGSQAADYSEFDAKIAFVLDSDEVPGTIITRSPAQYDMEYLVWGRAAHAGAAPEKGINAIHIAAKAIAEMATGRIDSETTCNFGVISGGQARNAVPEYCRIYGEARSLNRQKLEDLVKQLTRQFIDGVEKAGGKAQVNSNLLYQEVILDSKSRSVQLAVEAVRSTGLEPELRSTGGGSDASIIHNSGIICNNLGIGMTDVHTTGEYIKIDDLVKVTEIVLALIKTSMQQETKEKL